MSIGPFDTDEEAWAWAAGLFEGEGHIDHRRYKEGHPAYGKFQRGLVLGMCDEDPVRLFHEIVGAGRIRIQQPPEAHSNWRTQYRWKCTSWPDTERILMRLLPMLGERRGAAARALLANPAQPMGAWLKKDHCKHGHPLSGDNVYEWRGKRFCRTCHRIRQAGYQRAKRASTQS